jgi:Holliday junction resolvasome RuvABC endonuclease subunit
VTILAIDPGLTCTGVVLLYPNGGFDALTLCPPKELDWRDRASWIVWRLSGVFSTAMPQVLAIEEGYVQPHGRGARPALPEALAASLGVEQRDPSRQKQAQSRAALRTAELRGQIAGLAARTGCRVVGVQPSQALRALTGDGSPLSRGARKATMGAWARIRYPGHEWTEDTADALGVGLAAERVLLDEKLREGGSR